MRLTLEEAATRWGKSVRQVRYMIQKGQLPAKKVAGHWFVSADDLPQSPRQAQAARRKREQLRDAVEEVLSLDPRAGPPRFSLRDIRAFQIGLPVYRRALQLLSPDHPALSALRQSLEHLSRGCHRFDKDDKEAAYRLARDEASRAVCALLIDPGAAQEGEALATKIEQDMMAALVGLLRRLDRPPSRRPDERRRSEA